MNRRVLVVGSSSPIGTAIGRAFAAAGDRVVGVALEPTTDPAFTAGLVLDCSTSSGCDAAVAESVRILGGLDVLVPAAAAQPVAPAGETTDAQWQAALDTILSGAFYLFRAALPHFAPGSAMVAIGSVNAFLAAPGFPAYAAAKAGLHGLVRQLALEYGPRGIRVNAVAPGTIVASGASGAAAEVPISAVTTGAIAGEDVSGADGGTNAGDEGSGPAASVSSGGAFGLAAGYPIGRVGRPEEVADAVVFLAGNGFITGVTLPVDGGLSIASPAAFLRPDLQERWKRAAG